MENPELIDPQLFNEVAGQMPHKVGQLVAYFVADATAQLNAIETALNGTPAEAATIAGGFAHQLKSAARQLGAVALSATARELEHACRSTPAAPLDQLSTLHRQLRAQLPPTAVQLEQLAQPYRAA